MKNPEPYTKNQAGGNAIVLFDGVCNLCNGTVRFLIRSDHRNRFKFTSLQGDPGIELLKQFKLPGKDLSSFVLVENGNAYTRSTAALRVLRILGFPYNLLYVFILVPGAIRNVIYDLISRNRYRWFGKKEECWLPSPELQKRFL